jgi:uncharacterized membrane protein YhaH (DUF805 family)
MSGESSQPVAGWYPDPSGAPRYRYFDGELWTDHYHGGAMTTGVPTAAKSPIEYWRIVMIDNFANFDGRARRAEYWWTYLINGAAFVVLLIMGAIIGSGGLVLPGLFILVAFIPALAVSVRRLHDTDKSGWWLLIVLAPFGGIILLIFQALESDRGSNRYGPSPKYP